MINVAKQIDYTKDIVDASYDYLNISKILTNRTLSKRQARHQKIYFDIEKKRLTTRPRPGKTMYLAWAKSTSRPYSVGKAVRAGLESYNRKAVKGELYPYLLKYGDVLVQDIEARKIVETLAADVYTYVHESVFAEIYSPAFIQKVIRKMGDYALAETLDPDKELFAGGYFSNQRIPFWARYQVDKKLLSDIVAEELKRLFKTNIYAGLRLVGILDVLNVFVSMVTRPDVLEAFKQAADTYGKTINLRSLIAADKKYLEVYAGNTPIVFGSVDVIMGSSYFPDIAEIYISNPGHRKFNLDSDRDKNHADTLFLSIKDLLKAHPNMKIHVVPELKHLFAGQKIPSRVDFAPIPSTGILKVPLHFPK